MITISYMAMGILIAAVNCFLLMAIALFLMLYLKTQKDVLSIKQLIDKVANKKTTRIEEIGNLLGSCLQLDKQKKSEISQTLNTQEVELYTLIAETYVDRDNKKLLTLDESVESLFKTYIQAVEAHITKQQHVADDSVINSIGIIFKKYMAATDAELDDTQDYSVEQMIELVEKHEIKSASKIEVEDVVDSLGEPQAVEPLMEQSQTEIESQTAEQIQVQSLNEEQPQESEPDVKPEVKPEVDGDHIPDANNKADENQGQNTNE